MQAISTLVSNPGVAVLLGIIVTTLGTALNAFLTNRLEQKRMDREDRRQQENRAWEAEQRNKEEVSAKLEEKKSLYHDFVLATQINPPASLNEEYHLDKLYYRLIVLASPPVSAAARLLRLEAHTVFRFGYGSASGYYDVKEDADAAPYLMSLEEKREAFLSAVRDELEDV